MVERGEHQDPFVTASERPSVVDVSEALSHLPADKQEHMRALSTQFRQLLASLFPTAPDETIRSDRICVLTAPAFDCVTGTAVYVRDSGAIETFFLFQHIKLDIETGEPSVERLHGQVTETGSRPRTHLLASTPAVGVAKEVATNLSFALPHPFGPVTAAALSVIFGDLFGQSGPSLLQQISDLIDAAVQQIEDFLKDNQYQQARKDFADFFNVTCKDSAANGDPMSRDLAEHVLPK